MKPHKVKGSKVGTKLRELYQGHVDKYSYILVAKQLMQAGETVKTFRSMSKYLLDQRRRLIAFLTERGLSLSEAGLDRVSVEKFQTLSKDAKKMCTRKKSDFATVAQCEAALRDVQLSVETAELLRSLFESVEYYKNMSHQCGSTLHHFLQLHAM